MKLDRIDYTVFAIILAVILAVILLAIFTAKDSQAPDAIAGGVERIQRALKATGKPRYDPCGIDDIPGPHFYRAYINYRNDQSYKESIRRMEGKQK